MHIKLMSAGHNSFVSLCSLDLENETFSQDRCRNKFRTIFDLKRLCENLKNGSIYFLNVNHACLIMFTIIPKFH